MSQNICFCPICSSKSSGATAPIAPVLTRALQFGYPSILSVIWTRLNCRLLKLETKDQIIQSFNQNSSAESFLLTQPLSRFFLEFCSDLQAWLLSEWMHNYKDCLIEDKKFKKIGNKLYALKYFGFHFFSNFESFLKKRWRLTFERQPET